MISVQSNSAERENYKRMNESKDLCREDIRDHPSSSFHHLFINSVNKNLRFPSLNDSFKVPQ